MPCLLTIPTEIRLKILDYAISDLSGSESLIKRVDIPWEVSEEYCDRFVRKLRRGNDQRYLKNPNVNVPLVCRQIRMECNSPQVRKPTLDVEDAYIQGYTSNWPVLYYWKDLKIAKMMAQISTLRMRYHLEGEVWQFRLRGSKRNQEEYRQRLLDRLVSRLIGGDDYRWTGYCCYDFEIEIDFFFVEDDLPSGFETTVKLRRASPAPAHVRNTSKILLTDGSDNL